MKKEAWENWANSIELAEYAPIKFRHPREQDPGVAIDLQIRILNVVETPLPFDITLFTINDK